MEETGPAQLSLARLSRLVLRLGIATCLVILSFSSLVLSGGAQESAPANNALVMFVHASPDAADVDIYVDESLVAEAVGFGTMSDYVLVPEGSRTVRVVPAGGSADAQALLESDDEFDADTFYVVALAGYLNDLEANVYTVDVSQLDETTNARVRVINLIPDSEDLDVYQVGGEAIAEGLSFDDASDYVDVPANSYELEVRTADQGTLPLTAPAYQVEANMAYDLVLIGEIRSGAIELRAIGTPTNQPCGSLLGIGSADDACVRFVHASPDAPAVDVYLDDVEQPAVRELGFGMASDYIPVPEGEHQVRLVPVGGTLDEPLVDTDVDVDSGQAYIVAASNPIDDIATDTYEVDQSPIGGNQTRIRAIHKVTNLDEVDLALSGTVVFEDLGAGDATDYDLIQASTYEIEIRMAGDPAAVISSPGVLFDAGMVYDIFAIGSEDAGNLGFLVVSSAAPNTASPGVVQPGGSATPPATPGPNA